MKLKTPITYYGGKQNMLKHIRPLIPSHTLYCEPFAGGAAVFFDKAPVKVNVINDLNGELINFYRTVFSSPEALRAEINQSLHCREQHQHAWYVYNHPHYFTTVQRALAVFMLSKLGFAGKLSSSFGFDKSEGRHPKKMRFAKDLISDGLIDLLERSTIECDDAFKVITRYDCHGAWYFIDPPYVGSNIGEYAGMFNDQSLAELLGLCATLQGKFMLTMFPNGLIKEHATRHGWHIHAVDRQVSAAKVQHRRRQEEWMVVNYTL